LKFYKYHGTGNDFVMINGFNQIVDYKKLNTETIAKICDRRFGIGADGLIVLEKSELHDFKMIYFNSDGNLSSMCGNGGRCIVQFAFNLGCIGEECTFEAIDGLHEGKVNSLVSVKMIDVEEINSFQKDKVLDTGSPHYIKFVENVDTNNFIEEAKSIRHNDTFDKEGINVNFVKKIGDKIKIRTFERGVEDETFSCGTGVVAASIVASEKYPDLNTDIDIIARGGMLNVSFEKIKDGFTNIWLTGPAQKVFEGEIDTKELMDT